MVTEIDKFGLKERIVDILDSDSDLYDATGASGKVRKIVAGSPHLENIDSETVLPYVFVTNSELSETITPVSVISNAWKSLTHNVQFDIYLYVEGKNGQDTEEKLDDLTKLLLEVLEENNQLKNPSTGLDPKVATCWPLRIIHRNRGEFKQYMIITLKCIVLT